MESRFQDLPSFLECCCRGGRPFPLGSCELAVVEVAAESFEAAVARSSYEAPAAGRRCPPGAFAFAAATATCSERVSGRLVGASHGREQIPGA